MSAPTTPATSAEASRPEASPPSPAPPSPAGLSERLRPFVVGGAAGVTGWLFIHPADVIKTRQQTAPPGGGARTAASTATATAAPAAAPAAAPTAAPPASAPTVATSPRPGTSPLSMTTAGTSTVTATPRGGVHPLGPIATGRSIVAAGGPSALYTGLSAALTRQVTYTTLRLGLYATFRSAVVGDDATGNTPPPSLAQKLGIGLAAGGLAAAACCPVEVAMVRMYADGALPPAVRRNYSNVGSALRRMWAEEGAATLWRGAQPTVARACVVSAVQLGTYDQAKQVYAGWGAPEGVGLHLASSLTSGLAYSIVSLPIDIAKSKQQFQHREGGGGGSAPGGELKYRGLAQTVVRVAREEGLRKLYAGFGMYFVRCGGHTVGMFLAYEQLNRLWGKAFGEGGG
ncbi:hypothetical protein MMPV_007365 [Pyropia vietnamensis]